MSRACSIADCAKPYNSRGYCSMHASRVVRYGTPEPTASEGFHPRRIALDVMLARKTEKTETCWLWRGNLCRKGYGRFRLAGVNHSAHRASYEIHVGPIPDGLEIDHLCRVRNCVNPEHLEAVDHRTNVLRSPDTIPGREIRQALCPLGHEYTQEGDGDRSHRICRTCRPKRKTVAQRFAQWLAEPNARGCVLWTGEVHNGYPRFFNRVHRVQASRFAYESFIGPIPEGAVVRQSCGDRLCVAPEHLEATLDPRWRPSLPTVVAR